MHLSLRTALPVVALSLALTGCTGSPGDDAPEPVSVQELPTPVQSLVTTTDVGQYLGTPKEGVSEADIESTIAKLQTMEGVQSATRREDGVIDLVFRGDPSAEARQAAVAQLAAVATIDEGV